jgi:hypothetical protein
VQRALPKRRTCARQMTLLRRQNQHCTSACMPTPSLIRLQGREPLLLGVCVLGVCGTSSHGLCRTAGRPLCMSLLWDGVLGAVGGGEFDAAGVHCVQPVLQWWGGSCLVAVLFIPHTRTCSGFAGAPVLCSTASWRCCCAVHVHVQSSVQDSTWKSGQYLKSPYMVWMS